MWDLWARPFATLPDRQLQVQAMEFVEHGNAAVEQSHCCPLNLVSLD
jgi:hypothetical protein